MSGEIGNMQATVTLPVRQWNQIIDVLGKSDWHTVNPLIAAIVRQMQQSVTQETMPTRLRSVEDQPA
jgi:hypothetical protein